MALMLVICRTQTAGLSRLTLGYAAYWTSAYTTHLAPLPLLWSPLVLGFSQEPNVLEFTELTASRGVETIDAMGVWLFASAESDLRRSRNAPEFPCPHPD